MISRIRSPFYIFFLNPVYVAARSLRSLRSNYSSLQLTGAFSVFVSAIFPAMALLFLFHVYEYFECAILLDRLHLDIPLPDTILRGSIFYMGVRLGVSLCL